MTQPIATFCSFALLLWGYQTGLWIFAIPMVVVLEGREFVRRRWPISWELLQALHVLAAILWLFSILLLPPSSPSPLSYAARYQILRGLPIALFPLMVAQTYCVNVGAIYHNRIRQQPSQKSSFSLYYPYFGICLLAASATGGNNYVFLAAVLLLVTGVLWGVRSPRFGSSIFYGLIVFAMMMSLAGAHQFYWLEANVSLPSLSGLTSWLANIEVPWGGRTIPNRGPIVIDLTDEIENFESASSDSAQLPRSQDGLKETDASSSESESAGDLSGDSKSSTSNSSSSITLPSGGGGGNQETVSSSSSEGTKQSANTESEINQNVESSTEGNDNSSAGETTESKEGSDPGQSNDTNEATTDKAPTTETANSTVVSSSETPSDRPTTSKPSSISSSLPGNIQQSGGVANPETSQTRIGSLGSLQQSNAILFRVKPLGNRQELPYPLRIREATYNQYRSGNWDAANLKFSERQPSGPQRWTFANEKGPFSIQIGEVLKPKSGLLKLPVGASEIQGLAVDSLSLNQYGAVSFQREAQAPLNYKVRFDPNRFEDSRPTEVDRTVPKSEQKAIQTVLKTLKLQGKSESEKLQAIAAFFRQGFQYSLELPTSSKDKTPLASFLLDHQRGHCEYYASATSLLLRAAGIPTRYVVGYSVSEYNPSTQDYVVRVRDAHAWVMAYVNGNWITVDTTPSSGASVNRNGEETVEEQVAQQTPAITPENKANNQQGQRSGEPGKTENQGDRPSPGEASDPEHSQVQNPDDSTSAESWDKSLQKGMSETWSGWMEQLKQALSNCWSWLQERFDWFSDKLWFGSFLALGVAIAPGTALWIWRLYRRPKQLQRRRRRKRAKVSMAANAPEDMNFTFQDIEERLQSMNLQRHSAETPKRWVKRLEDELSAAQFEGLKEILDLHYQDRFDPAGLNEGDRKQLASLIEAWLINFRQRRVGAKL